MTGECKVDIRVLAKGAATKRMKMAQENGVAEITKACRGTLFLKEEIIG
ncbi:hypothetical protein [Pseudoalteromonas luteoviolacea]|uniref:Uncharacterized protein n=1 Tax=Pseudoalteromonas luteoviolacea S4054 TaxID=1129367 RepID=A0A0F6A8Q8_9GAMM|nr:hypothetical protein [Pseudoalteromonas luteoviolacea]KKE82602.1 hypothetical protein N479_17480 [Pseudoalteromonas luteoviolacea S4054]KZN69964.1 hypothetical protein N481_21345 [Pseudoalteromonas luteoviolacea S4047-1]